MFQVSGIASGAACFKQEPRDRVARCTLHEMQRLSAGLKVGSLEVGGELSLRYPIDQLNTTILHLPVSFIWKYMLPYDVQSDEKTEDELVRRY
jgi:hypothetical protein